MKSQVAIRESQIPFNVLLGLIGITFVLVWLPLWRCIMDGSSYQWGMSYFGHFFVSKGISADLWVLIIQVPFFALLIYSFYWLKNRTLFYILLLAWFVLVFGNYIYIVISEGGVQFQGDTLGINVSITGLVIGLSVVCLLAIAWVIWKDTRLEDKAIAWGRKNKLWASILLAFLPLQLILFATGEPHGTTDEIGVMITILQAILLPFVFIPRRA